jgi:glycosyltransferase involved in cell wall biosynthesis
VLSLYEGFFAGGARILHTDVVAGLHGADQHHRVLSLASHARREGTVQSMTDDARYRRLIDAGVEVMTLGREAGADPLDPSVFTPADLWAAASAIADADVVLTLKEQPLGLLLALERAGMMPRVPVATCLHRSDPTHAGPALGWLADAARSGLVTATISCAASTSDAYARAGIDGVMRDVVPNGVDLDRFRPGTAAEIADGKHALGIPEDAPVVLYAARFDAMKDPGLLLAAVAAHRAAGGRAHYVLCGAGMTADNPLLRDMARDAGLHLDARVHLLGLRDDMPMLHRIADIVALTSAFGEASPLCLLEGAASGATPVTTAVGDAAASVAGIGRVTRHDASDIARTWDEVLRERPALRRAAIHARPRLGRDRMIADYRVAIEACVRAGALAA